MRGSLKISQLQAGEGSLTRLQDVTLEEKGRVLNLGSATIAPRARVEMARTTLLRHAKLRMNGTVRGWVFMARLLCAPKSIVDMDDTATIDAGTLSIVGWDQARDANFTASHMQVTNAGFFGIFDGRLSEGHNHVEAMRLTEAATWVTERTAMFGGLALDGADRWSRLPAPDPP